MVPTMKYEITLLPVSLPEDRYLEKEGILVVFSVSNGLVKVAEPEALRCWMAAAQAGARTAGNCCRAQLRTSVPAADVRFRMMGWKAEGAEMGGGKHVVVLGFSGRGFSEVELGWQKEAARDALPGSSNPNNP